MHATVHSEYRAHRHDHWWFAARRTIFARLLAAKMPLPPGARILEIGPGHGVNLPVLGAHGPTFTLDVDRGSLAGSRAQGARGAVCGDAQEPPLVAGSFALVCAFDVLEHLQDDPGALRAWHTLLAPQGRLFLTVPALRLLWGRQDVLSGHERRYGRRELAARLQAAGFVLEQLSFCNALLFVPILLVRLLMRPFLPRARAGGGSSDFGLRLPRPLERLLYHAFALEAGWLVRHDLPLGVSLLAIARKAP